MTPKAIVSAMEARIGLVGAPRQLRDAIEDELLSIGLGAASAAEQASAVRNKVIAEITSRRDASEELGEISILNLRGSGDEVVFGSSYVFADDNEQISSAKLNRVFADDIYHTIRGISFNQFEDFGRCILRELGSVNPKVTRQSGDQGIDFYGDISLGIIAGADPAIMKLMHETRLILVGQAKHYPEQVIGPAIVRELVGALSLSRTFTFSQDDIDLLNEVKLFPFSPVLALLFSTGSFTKGARHLAKKAGIIAFSGWQLAVFLADRGVGIETREGKRHFELSFFQEWLSE